MLRVGVEVLGKPVGLEEAVQEGVEVMEGEEGIHPSIRGGSVIQRRRLVVICNILGTG